MIVKKRKTKLLIVAMTKNSIADPDTFKRDEFKQIGAKFMNKKLTINQENICKRKQRKNVQTSMSNKGSTTAKLIIEGVLESPGALDACLSEKQKKKWEIQ